MDKRSVNRTGADGKSGAVTIPRSFLRRHKIVPGRDDVRVIERDHEVVIRPLE